ncbi:sugar nucleotide-binding protein [Leucobacter sp. UT-8R-CII-1-4]|nr:sugar nucleotide-binding protein [Leucobacter sp. UT-8R-CII-1-4]
MRALVLGARGAVGRETVAELKHQNHQTVSVGRGKENELQADISTATGRETLLAELHKGDVIVNASGREDIELAELAVRAPFIEISATGRYLDALEKAVSERTHESRPQHSLVLGAGIAPGLSTILLAALDSRPGDNLDLGVTLGSGEKHGAAAMEWTESLIGAAIYQPVEAPAKVLNFRESKKLPGLAGRSRTHLRADFPDQVILGAKNGTLIRSYLALSSASMTTSLALLARMPRLASLMNAVPPIGSEDWRIFAANRRTGETIAAEGHGQSHATGVLAAFAAERAFARSQRDEATGTVTMADLCTAEEAASRLRATLQRTS